MMSKHSKKLQEIGFRIASLRKSKDLTQEGLEEKASISYSYFTKIEALIVILRFLLKHYWI